MVKAVLAMAKSPAAGQPQGGGGIGPSLFVLAIIFFIFYFLLFRPQQKQQKKLQEMRAGLKKGDKVVTSGGIHGTVLSVTDDLVSLQIADKVKIDLAKSSIAGKRE
ncbi:MAG: preprotein translocase subunit YajC [bacterium]